MRYYMVRTIEKKEIKVIHKIFDAAHVAYLRHVSAGAVELVAVDTSEFGDVQTITLLYTYDEEAKAIIIHHLVLPNGVLQPV